MPKPPSTDAVPDVLLVLGDPRTCEPLSALLELAGYRTVARWTAAPRPPPRSPSAGSIWSSSM
ncbi:hypothetical protein ACQEV2_12070 [Streptomyces sp. CA-251387]|uniref:hypothetical protein n=1 Tax=Streptomyces sp. CA-251387 TaxID=3240064 RepID=UPI003D8C567E